MRKVSVIVAGVLLLLQAYGQQSESFWNTKMWDIAEPSSKKGWIRLKKGRDFKTNTFFAENRQAFGLQGNDQMQQVNSVNGKSSVVHTRFQQYHQGVKVEGAQYLLHEKNGEVYAANGKIVEDISMGTTPAVLENDAFQIARNAFGATKYSWEVEANPDQPDNLMTKLFQGSSRPVGELLFCYLVNNGDMSSSNYKLAYKYDITSVSPNYDSKSIYVDASTGNVLKVLSLMHNTHCDDGCCDGSVSSLYNGGQDVTTRHLGFPLYSYVLEDNCRGGGIDTRYKEGPQRDPNNTFVNSYEDRTTASLHWAVEMTYDYFFEKHERDSYDNDGGEIVSSAGYVQGVYENGVFVRDNHNIAKYDGNFDVMFFGDGEDGSLPWVSLEVVGHEFTHGITDYTADLTLQGESGALDESFGDIFGTMVEFYGESGSGKAVDWTAGEDYLHILRNISDPSAYNHPDTYQGDNWVDPTDMSVDIGGVHTNSGVQNYWFYLLAMGGSGINDNGDYYSVKGIGRDKAAFVAYMNLTTELTELSNFTDAANGAVAVAIDEWGECSFEVNQVINAWYAVGLWDQPASDFVSCDCDPLEINITENTTWNPVSGEPDHYNVNGDLIVKSGHTLVINPGVKVTFCGANSGIKVERGATLILDGCTLTASEGERWRGIEVWGELGVDMPTAGSLSNVVTGSGNTYSNTTNQGVMIMKGGAIVEHAEEGFRNYRTGNDIPWAERFEYRGGVVWAQNATFRNCQRSMEFLKWEGPSDYVSRVRLTNFVVDDNMFITDKSYSCDFPSELEPVRTFITMWDVHGIEFWQSTITNSFSGLGPLFQGTGIRSIDASYKIKNNNVFNNLTYGVSIAEDNGGLTNGVRILGNTFNNCLRGLEVKGFNFGNAKNNTFNIPFGATEKSSSYGISLFAANGFNVESNTFVGQPGPGSFSYGIITSNSAFTGGRIDKNTFIDLAVGTQTEGLNPNLIISCNDYTNIGKAWSINPEIGPYSSGMNASTCAQYYASATFRDQGTSCLTNPELSIQVDNTFNDVGKVHIHTFLTFSYAYNFEFGDNPINAGNCVNLVKCENGNAKCSNTDDGSVDPSLLLVRPPSGLAGLINAKTDPTERRRLMGEIVRIHLEQNKPEKVEQILKLVTGDDSKKMLIPYYLREEQVGKARVLYNSIVSTDYETQSFKDLYGVQIELMENGLKRTDFVNDPVKKQIIEDVANDGTRYSYVAQTLLRRVNFCQTFNLTPTPAGLYSGNPGGANPNLYKLEAVPNPANNSFVAKFDLGDRTNGKIVIKDVITGLEMKSIVLNSTNNTQMINISNLQQGNYILELHGDDLFLKSEHLMIY